VNCNPEEDTFSMSPEEKTVIGGIFERLKGAANAPRDAEADKFIADQIKVQPYAPYVMAQSIYAQEQALTGMQQQVEQLQAQVQQLEQYAQQVQQQQAQASSGFLGGLFGGGAKPVPQPPQMDRAPFQRNAAQQQPPANFQQGGAPQGGPWGQQPQQQGGPWGQQGQPQQRAGMGFLGTAAMTAAGVAGGMLAANALTNMFTGGSAGSAQAATKPAAESPASPASETASAGEPNYDNHSHDASYDDGGDFGGGGGDDWA
jgi:uncharacterized protein